MITCHMTQELVGILTFHKRVFMFVYNWVKHIQTMTQISYK
jgi:hypothetical protein